MGAASFGATTLTIDITQIINIAQLILYIIMLCYIEPWAIDIIGGLSNMIAHGSICSIPYIPISLDGSQVYQPVRSQQQKQQQLSRYIPILSHGISCNDVIWGILDIYWYTPILSHWLVILVRSQEAILVILAFWLVQLPLKIIIPQLW